MVPFGKQQEICAIFRRQAQKSCQETAGRLFIEDGVVVIANEKSASRLESRALTPNGRSKRLSELASFLRT